MRTVWQMIKLKVINNRKLWICCLCIVAMTLLCFLSPFPSGDPDVKETVLKVWLSTDREQLLQMDEMASIYSVAAGFRNMEWFIVLLPLVAVVPGIFEFSEVWFGGNFYLTALRGTKKQFARKWCCGKKVFLRSAVWYCWNISVKKWHPVMRVLYMSDTNPVDRRCRLRHEWWSSCFRRIIYFMIVRFGMNLGFLIGDMQYSSVCGWVELPCCFTGR